VDIIVSKQGKDEVLVSPGIGEYFGEVSLMFPDNVRTAGVVAGAEGCTCLQLSGAAWEHVKKLPYMKGPARRLGMTARNRMGNKLGVSAKKMDRGAAAAVLPCCVVVCRAVLCSFVVVVVVVVLFVCCRQICSREELRHFSRHPSTSILPPLHARIPNSPFPTPASRHTPPPRLTPPYPRLTPALPRQPHTRLAPFHTSTPPYPALPRLTPALPRLTPPYPANRTLDWPPSTQEISFFQKMDRSLLDVMGGCFSMEAYSEGQVIMEEGKDTDEGFFVVVDGSCRVTSRNSGDQGLDKDAKLMEHGDYFGEIGLVEKIPRTATVTCHENCLLLRLKKEVFDRFMEMISLEMRQDMAAEIKKRATHMISGEVADLVDASNVALGMKVKA
jgi:CRP-like cAMP-binding protein